jgi:acyl dehydratase
MYSEKEVRDASTGDLLATTRSTTFLRGDGGFGGPDGPVETPHSLPDTPPDEIVDMPTRPEQALYYRLNGDDNPLHAAPAVAEKAGFPRPILHGLCTLGVIGHALLRTLGAYDAARFQSLAMRFSAPVFPGETVRVEMWRDGSFRALVPGRGVVAVNNGLAVFTPGEA